MLIMLQSCRNGREYHNESILLDIDPMKGGLDGCIIVRHTWEAFWFGVHHKVEGGNCMKDRGAVVLKSNSIHQGTDAHIWRTFWRPIMPPNVSWTPPKRQ